MVKVFEIVLDDPPVPRGFPSGSKLSGRVLIEADEEKTYRLIEIGFTGSGKVTWAEGHGDERERRRANEEYVRDKVTLWEEGEQSLALPEGRHEFPFTFCIPDTCPSSLEADLKSSTAEARISYVLSGRITTKGALKADHTVDKTVRIVKETSNTQSSAEPLRQFDEGTECCLCCVSGAVVLSAELPQSGFSPGESIPLAAEVVNGTSRDLRVEASLVEVTRLKAGHSVKRVSRMLLQELSHPFRGRSTSLWSSEMGRIPEGPTTIETPGGMISISYEVRVRLGLRLGQKLEVSFPVLLGGGSISPS